MAEKTFFTSTPANTPSLAAASKHHLTLWNGSASSIVKVYKIVATGFPTLAVVGLVIPLLAERILNAAPTGGTNCPIVAAGSTGGVLDVLPSGIVAATGPTVLLANEQGVAFGIGEVSGEETGAANTALIYDPDTEWVKPLEVAPGQGITVKQGGLASAGAIHVRVSFTVV